MLSDNLQEIFGQDICPNISFFYANKERKICEMVKKSERFIRLEEITKPQAGKITRNKKGISIDYFITLMETVRNSR